MAIAAEVQPSVYDSMRDREFVRLYSLARTRCSDMSRGTLAACSLRQPRRQTAITSGSRRTPHHNLPHAQNCVHEPATKLLYAAYGHRLMGITWAFSRDDCPTSLRRLGPSSDHVPFPASKSHCVHQPAVSPVTLFPSQNTNQHRVSNRRASTSSRLIQWRMPPVPDKSQH